MSDESNNNSSSGENRRGNRRRRPHHKNRDSRNRRPRSSSDSPQADSNRHDGRRPDSRNKQAADRSEQGPGQSAQGRSGQRRRNRSNQDQNSSNKRHYKNRSSSGSHQRNQPQKKRRRIKVKNLRSGALIKRYGELWEQHEFARKRFFEMYHRVDDRKRHNLEKRFIQAIENMRKFEKALQDWQVVILSNHFKFYKEDLDYSTNHNLSLEGDDPGEGPFETPHLSIVQKERPKYNDDTEESVGTMEDLAAYMEEKRA